MCAWRSISASSAITRSWFLTGSPAAVFQPRRFQPWIHFVIESIISVESVTMQIWLEAGSQRSPSSAAVYSMRLLVVCGSPPASSTGCGRAGATTIAAPPPGPRVPPPGAAGPGVAAAGAVGPDESLAGTGLHRYLPVLGAGVASLRRHRTAAILGNGPDATDERPLLGPRQLLDPPLLAQRGRPVGDLRQPHHPHRPAAARVAAGGARLVLALAPVGFGRPAAVERAVGAAQQVDVGAHSGGVRPAATVSRSTQRQ